MCRSWQPERELVESDAVFTATAIGVDRRYFALASFETSPFRVEWMRFEADCPLPELVKTVPHVAFEVDDLTAELEGKELLIAPNSPSPGIMVAFILDNGAPIEFLQHSPGVQETAEVTPATKKPDDRS